MFGKAFAEEWMRNEAAGGGAHESAGGDGLESARPPALVPFAEMDYWYLASEMQWTEPGGAGITIVPRGFTTDFASIPWVFWTFLPRIGLYGYPAVVHDWHYWDQSLTRDEADRRFDANLAEAGVDSWTRATIVKAVQLRGGVHWKNNADLKLRKTKRVLHRFPPDTRVKWKDWVKDTSVFA